MTQDSFGPSGRAPDEKDFRGGCALSEAAPSAALPYSGRVRCTSCANGSGPNGCTDCLGKGLDPSAFAGGVEAALNDAYAEGRKDECEEWERRTEHLFVERAHLMEQNARLLDVLCGIHGLLPSPPIETSDGKTYVFQDPDANETLRALRIRIAGIEEAVAAIRNAQFTATRQRKQE